MKCMLTQSFSRPFRATLNDPKHPVVAVKTCKVTLPDEQKKKFLQGRSGAEARGQGCQIRDKPSRRACAQQRSDFQKK